MITHTFIWIFIIVIIICAIYPNWVTIQPSVVGNKIDHVGTGMEYGLFKLKYRGKETSNFNVIKSLGDSNERTIYMSLMVIGILLLVFASISRKSHSEDPHLNLVLLLLGACIIFITSISALFGDYAKYSITTNSALIQTISNLSEDELLQKVEQQEEESDNSVFLAAIKKPSVCVFVLLHISLFMISYALTSLSNPMDSAKFYF